MADYIDIITKQLNKKSPSKIKTISYFEKVPLNQVHIDTFFYRNDILHYKYPFLIIVDVATKYIHIVPQQRKNENILVHLENYCKEVREKFPTAVKENKLVTIISDGAKEFNVLKSKFNHKVSLSIHKAVYAETYIARVKVLVRKILVKHFIKEIYDGKVEKISTSTLLEMLKTIQEEINKKAKITKKKEIKITENDISKFNVGDVVFIKSQDKFYEQLRRFKKKSYINNYVAEPFYVSKVIFFNGIFKYQVISFFDGLIEKYFHYEEELQLVDPRIAKDYIEKYRIRFNSTEKPKVIKKFIPK